MATFVEQFHSAMLRIQSRSRTVSHGVVVAVGERLLKYSPVGNPSYWKTAPPPGYVPGQFKGSWHHSYGTISTDTSATIDRTGGSSRTEFLYGALANPFAVHYLTNNLPYAMRLERGHHSRQVPASGMVGTTANDFQGIVKMVLQANTV